MEELVNDRCEACRADAPRLDEVQIESLLAQLPDWHVIERDGIKQLERQFGFRNFVQALEFTNQVGQLAEEQGHHPDILTAWGRVTVTWWSHKIKGLHRNDFVMAAKTDRLYQ